MPRYFKPVGGFSDRSILFLKLDDDGNSYHVRADGSETNVGHIDRGQVWRPTWNLTELLQLVKDEKWEEAQPPATPQPAAVHADEQDAAQHPVAASADMSADAIDAGETSDQTPTNRP